MFNLGFSEIILIVVIALIFIGPKQLPEIAKIVGKIMAEFKKITGDITNSIMNNKKDDEQQ